MYVVKKKLKKIQCVDKFIYIIYNNNKEQFKTIKF